VLAPVGAAGFDVCGQQGARLGGGARNGSKSGACMQLTQVGNDFRGGH